MSSIDTTNQTRGRHWAALLVALAVLLAGSVAFAENGNGGGDDQDLPEGPLKEELTDYWSVDRDVAVIKDRLYRRKGRFGIGLHAGLMSSEPFFWYLPVGVRANYYFSNNFGIELEGTFMGADGVLRHKTDLTKFVSSERPGFDPSTDALDQLGWRATALATWHPLYGKLALLQRKLAHFDFNLAAGLGVVGAERPNASRSGSTNKVLPEFAFGGGLDFFVSNNVVIRLIGRGYLYPGPTNCQVKRYDADVQLTNNDTEVNAGDASVIERYQSVSGCNNLASDKIGKVDGQTTIQKANFFQSLEFNTEFLLGVTYMF